jgi:hypothetical protein
MFCVKGFAGPKGAAPYSGFAAGVTAASDIAPSIAGAKLGESSVEPRTSVIGALLKGGLTNGTVSGPIGDGGQQFPLWIKVPLSGFPLAKSSWR